jgi:dihydrofolate reductase
MTEASPTGSNPMRKIIEYCLVSSDGIVLEDPFPFQDYVDDAYLRDRLGVFEACEASLWGRTTYERFARMLTGSRRSPPYIARLNAMQKYVFSSKLETAEWNNTTILRGDVVTEVTKLKELEGGDLLILGHGLVGETLLKHALLDVLDLAIHPVFVGHGKPLFREGQTATMKLTTTKSFSKLVKVSYDLQY